MTKLRELRQATGQSMSAFARKLGMHHSLASWIERGDFRTPPRWRPVIAEALRVSESEIFGDDGFAK